MVAISLALCDIHRPPIICARGSAERIWGEFFILLGTKKEHKPKLLSPYIFRWGRGLPREGVGAKKFDMSLETREIKLFGGISWDLLGYPGSARKFGKKRVCVLFLFWPLFWSGDF